MTVTLFPDVFVPLLMENFARHGVAGQSEPFTNFVPLPYLCKERTSSSEYFRRV